jgi:hypothetical protein
MIPPLLAIFSWPVIVAALFARLKPVHAIWWSILGAYLLLPNGRALDLPMVPTLDKDVVPAIATFIAAIIVVSRRAGREDPHILRGWLPRVTLINLCLAALVLGVVGTVFTNAEPVQLGPVTIPGLRPYDAVSLLLGAALSLLPFLLGRRFLGHPESHRILLRILVIAGAAYSLLALYEIRMSPQLNTMVYGYFQHKWNQHVRGDGFRPLVFLNHGLWLAIFLSSCILSAFVLFRTEGEKRRITYLLAAGWLLGTLVLSKSLGALAITLVLIPVVLFLGTRYQLMVAALIAGMILFYPMLRGAGLVPVERISSIAYSIDAGRAASLNYRLFNEDQLLEKAQQKPIFGWGSWGRNRIYDEETGRDESTTDGRWIIQVGMFGWVGYIGQFGTLCIGIVLLWWRSKSYEVTLATAGLAVVLAGNLIDLIPNAGLTPVTWMIAGALVGRIEFGRISEATKEPDRAPTSAGSRYTRFGPTGARPGNVAVRQVPRHVRGTALFVAEQEDPAR